MTQKHRLFVILLLTIILINTCIYAQTVQDVGRIYSVNVSNVTLYNQTQQFIDLVSYAYKNNGTVSIAGSKHSQGSQTAADGSVVLGMRDYNEVLNIDQERQQIIVQSGATWDEVQRAINPHGLAIKVMQSSNIFTVGGTMSANAHGRDLDQTAFITSVDSFRLLLANATIVNVSREKNKELFKLVIGGYGLFGVILDATINVTTNDVFRTHTSHINYTQFPQYFTDNIKNNDSVELLLIRPSIQPKNLFSDFTILTWTKENQTIDTTLTEEAHVKRDKFLFSLSRKYDWGKNLRWWLQKKLESSMGRLITRNNAMRPPEAPLELLQYNSKKNTDILQEYFIPERNFIQFAEEFKKILSDDKTNVISFTIRYVKSNNDTYLSYAPKEDSFAFIYYSNVKLSPAGLEQAAVTQRKIIDATLRNNGTYYLTYNLFPTTEQLRIAYPQIDYVFKQKKVYDSTEIFQNKFYQQYKADGVGEMLQ